MQKIKYKFLAQFIAAINKISFLIRILDWIKI